MSMSRRVSPSYVVGFAGIGAAVYYIFLFLPGVPVIGLPQIRMEIGASLAPLLGLILGPYIGGIAVLVGNIIKTLTPPNPYGVPFILCAPLSAVGAGMLAVKRWRVAMGILLAILIASMFTPPFYPVTEHWYVYTLAFFDKVVAVALIPIAIRMLDSGKSSIRYTALYLIFFIAREFDKAFGNFVFSLPPVYSGLFGLADVAIVRGLFMVSPAFYVAQYILEAVIGFAIAIPTVKALLRASGTSEILFVKNLKSFR
ncbi:MAG: hypothetical protein QXF17_00260 [Ignisphaera sp.]|uniref:ECF transporter S component n=1 Tax=Ignisphaera aggregans TaxID=334771 RepID=A0A7J3JPU4_9CREN